MSKDMKIVVKEVTRKRRDGLDNSGCVAEFAGYDGNTSLAKGRGFNAEEAIGSLFIRNRNHPVVYSIFSVSIFLPAKRKRRKP